MIALFVHIFCKMQTNDNIPINVTQKLDFIYSYVLFN